MSGFYCLSYPDGELYRSVASYWPRHFNPTPGWRAGDDLTWLDDLMLTLYDGACPDFLPNPLSLLIGSDRLLGALESVGENCARREVAVEDERRGPLDRRYSVFLPRVELDCLDRERSSILRGPDGSVRAVVQPVLIARAVPESVRMFRVAGCTAECFVDQSVVNAFRREKVTGVEFVRLGP